MLINSLRWKLSNIFNFVHHHFLRDRAGRDGFDRIHFSLVRAGLTVKPVYTEEHT